MFKFCFYLFLFYLLIDYIFDLRYLKYNPLYKKIKQEILYCFKNEKKEIFLGFLSCLGILLGFLLELLAITIQLLAKILAPVLKILAKEFTYLRARLKALSYPLIFFLYFLPPLLGLAAYDFRKGEPLEKSIERISPELFDVLYYSISGFLFCAIFFYILHDGAKNSPINQSLNFLYGYQKPSPSDHWFLRFCYWLHPETYFLGKQLGFHVVYIFYVYGTYYAVLFLYVFKGVLF